MKIKVSNGEILDKLSILEIKLEYIHDPEKIKNLKVEYEEIKDCAMQINVPYEIYNSLHAVNKLIWEIEEAIREKENLKEFDSAFIELARSVYMSNDKRAEIKNQINLITSSEIIEEKSYRAYS